MEHVQFPVGKFKKPDQITLAMREECIGTIQHFYSKLAPLVTKLSNQALAATYRPQGWNVRQLVHHIADSHSQAFARFKLALTEPAPAIKPYNEAAWAQGADYTVPIEPSLCIIKGVHARWATLLAAMTEHDFSKTYLHPEFNATYTLAGVLCLYDWHCRHHLAHINLALTNK